MYGQLFSMSFNNNSNIISRSNFEICHVCMENGLYVLKPYESLTYNSEIFRIVKQISNKYQKISNDDAFYLWHLKL